MILSTLSLTNCIDLTYDFSSKIDPTATRSMKLQYLFASVFDVGGEFGNLLFQSRFGFLLDFGEVGFEVGFLPVLFPFGVQGGVGGNRSINSHISFESVIAKSERVSVSIHMIVNERFEKPSMTSSESRSVRHLFLV